MSTAAGQKMFFSTENLPPFVEIDPVISVVLCLHVGLAGLTCWTSWPDMTPSKVRTLRLLSTGMQAERVGVAEQAFRDGSQHLATH